MRISLVLALTAWIFLSSCGYALGKSDFPLAKSDLALAQDDIGQSQIHPAHLLYFLKTIRESLELKFAATPRTRMLRQLEFSTRRLREVNSLIQVGNQDLIPPTLERYWSHISSLPDQKLEDDEMVKKIQDSLVIHLQVLERVYTKLSNPRAKMAVRAALNRIVQRLDTPAYAKLAACNLLLKEASSSALNQVERVVLLQRGQKCLKINQ